MQTPLDLATQYGFRVEYNPVVPHLINGTMLCRSKGLTWGEASEKWDRYYRDGKANGQTLTEHWPDVLVQRDKEPGPYIMTDNRGHIWIHQMIAIELCQLLDVTFCIRWDGILSDALFGDRPLIPKEHTEAQLAECFNEKVAADFMGFDR